jgi:hypothetical protein
MAAADALCTGRERMKLRILPLILVLSFILVFPPISPVTATQPAWSVYFSPKGGCTEAIVQEIGKAKSSILVQAYSFTSAPIVKALVDAHKQGRSENNGKNEN